MKKRLNIEKITKQYNTARMKYEGRELSSESVKKALADEGLSVSLIKRMISSPLFFQSFTKSGYGRGYHRGYRFPYGPLHISSIQNFFYPSKKHEEDIPSVSFEDAVKVLKNKYDCQIKVCKGFDEEAFKQDYPELYQKYLVYEMV